MVCSFREFFSAAQSLLQEQRFGTSNSYARRLAKCLRGISAPHLPRNYGVADVAKTIPAAIAGKPGNTRAIEERDFERSDVTGQMLTRRPDEPHFGHMHQFQRRDAVVPPYTSPNPLASINAISTPPTPTMRI